VNGILRPGIANVNHYVDAGGRSRYSDSHEKDC
jgi:hypothetical protein